MGFSAKRTAWIWGFCVGALVAGMVAPARTQTMPEETPVATTAGHDTVGDEDVETPLTPQERSFVPESLLLPPAHLLGDWLGWRTQLENSGVTPTLSWVSNLAGNPRGGRRQGFTEAENLGLDCLFDLEKVAGFEDTEFDLSMSQRSGVGLSQQYIGNVLPVQQVFGGETFKLVDVAVQHSFRDRAADVRFGRMAATDDFLVSEYFWAFMSNGIDGNPKGIFLNAPGTSAYPNAAWGTRLRLRPSERTYVMAGIYNGDPDTWHNEDHGLDWSLHGPCFVIAEAGYHRNGQPADTGLQGNYKIGGYYNGGSFANSAGRVLGATAGDYGLTSTTTTGNGGFYAIADQVLWRLGGKSDTRGVGVFSAIVVAPDDTINQMPFFCNGGIIARGLVPRRPSDSLGFAMIYGKFSEDLAAVQQIAHGLNPDLGVQDYELVYEWFYRMRMRDGAIFFQPDLQYIVNPGGARQYPNAFVVGAQVGMNF